MKRYVSILTIVLMSGVICMADVAYHSINKDVHNGTGQEAHGIKIVLKGQPALKQHFDGFPNANHFGHFTTDVENDKTIFWWSDPRGENDEPRPIPHCEWVHVGFELQLVGIILEAYWTDENGDRIGDFIRQPTQEIIQINGGLELKITNDLQHNLSVSFDLMGFAVLDQAIPLEQLNSNNPNFSSSSLTPFPDASGNTTLPPGASMSYKIPENPDKPFTDSYIIYGKGGKNGPNGGELAFRDFGQYGPVPPPPPFPALSEWGLIIMALLLVSAGAIVIWRKQRIAA